MVSLEYAMSVVTLAGIYSIIALGLNIILGYTGQPWLGHAGFVGIGSYVSAILAKSYDITFGWAFIAAVAFTAFIGLLVGIPCLRLREDFLAVTTIGFNFAIHGIIQYTPYFGGYAGIRGIPRPFSYEIYLILVLAVLIILALLSKKLADSWVGLAWSSIKEDEVAGHTLGVDIVKFKLLAIIIGSAYAGAGGSLLAHYLMNIAPDYLTFNESILMISAVVVGGAGTIVGAVFGASLTVVLPELFRFVSEYRYMIFGALIVLMMVFQPSGILGRGSFVRTRVSKRRWRIGTKYQSLA